MKRQRYTTNKPCRKARLCKRVVKDLDTIEGLSIRELDDACGGAHLNTIIYPDLMQGFVDEDHPGLLIGPHH